MTRLPRTRAALLLLPALIVHAVPDRTQGQEAVTLSESFRPGSSYRVEVQVKVTGELAVPLEKGKAPQKVTLEGVSRLAYEERVLPADDAGTLKTVRAYREVDFRRVVGNAVQDAGIRPSVRRMVVIKAPPPPGSEVPPRKAPFSPDGPLTWGEIDVVRTDVFTPALVPGLLPARPVRQGDGWKATAAAVLELTDLEKVDEGELAVKFLGVTAVDGRQVAKLSVAGTVRGVNEDGPNRQQLDGLAYFDLATGMLSYLSVRGTHSLLDGDGRTMGVVNGQFIMTRKPVAQLPPDLSDAALAGLVLKPGPENTLLLYDDPALGVRFVYPRGWRVGAVQGKQVTIDHARLGGGILITVIPPGKVPGAEDYLKEVGEFLQKEKAKVEGAEPPRRVRAEPVQLDRFGLDAAFGQDRARLEYAVLKQADGGATVAARLPAATAAELRTDVERIVRSLAVTKRIEER